MGFLNKTPNMFCSLYPRRHPKIPVYGELGPPFPKP